MALPPDEEDRILGPVPGPRRPGASARPAGAGRGRAGNGHGLAARAFVPAVVLLELGLLGLDGYQVAVRLQQEGLKKGLLIAMTGYGHDADRRRTRQSGFDHRLVKPVDPLELKALIGARAPS